MKGIKSGFKLKKNGNYELILNDKHLIHFALKKRLFVIILLFGFLFISFYSGFYIQSSYYSPNTYFFNTSNIEFQNIKLVSLYENSTILYNKIAPGVNGRLKIVIKNSCNDKYKYHFLVKENDGQPERPLF